MYFFSVTIHIVTVPSLALFLYLNVTMCPQCYSVRLGLIPTPEASGNPFQVLKL